MQMTHGLALLQLMVFLACFLKSFRLLYFQAKYIFDFLSLHTWQDIACNCWHISLLCSVWVANPRAKWGDFSRLISDLDLCSQGVNEIQKENIS